MITMSLTFGHALNESEIRGKVYDTCTGEVQDREELLRRFDAGDVRSLKTISRAKHPSYGRSELMPDGTSRPWNDEDRSAEMSRDEICAIFDAAAKVVRS